MKGFNVVLTVVLQMSLKNEDSYIYLNAIEGLATLADLFPSIVLNVLCEEYSDFTKNGRSDGHEVRLKLGEALVRATKLLGKCKKFYSNPDFSSI